MSSYGYGYYRCGCERCRYSGLMGPVMLVTIGILFLLSEFDVARFHYTWPVLLIVAGVVKVLQSSASNLGHVGYGVPPVAPPPAVPPTGSDQGQVPHV